MTRAFESIDLNLLKALNALLEERSVSRAAERLCITQSAMSKTLARLRTLFGDALLVRQGTKLVTTPLADELLNPLREIVARIEAYLAIPSFDPSKASAHVRIAAPDQFAFVFVSPLLERIQREAPGIVLDAQHLMDRHTDLLSAGLLDFAVTREDSFPPDFQATPLSSAAGMCWCRKGHALTALSSVNVEDLCRYPMVVLSNQSASQSFPPATIKEVRAEIERLKLKTRVIFDTSHVIAAIDALIRFDAILFAPAFLAHIPVAGDLIAPVSIAHLPAFRDLRTTVQLVQHRRTLGSPLHRWIADGIAALFLPSQP